jgi:hypothetical protein
MKAKGGQMGQSRLSLREYEKEHQYDAQEKAMFLTTLWLGMACLCIWLLMSFIL